MESPLIATTTTFAQAHNNHNYIDAVREVGIEFQERTIGAFRMFSLVITLHQDKRRQQASQRPKINNETIVVHRGPFGPLLPNTRRGTATVTSRIFGRQPNGQSSILQINNNINNNYKTGIQRHHTKVDTTTKLREMTVQVHAHTIGALHGWIAKQIQHHRCRQQQQQQSNKRNRPEPLLQEIIFDSATYDDCHDEDYPPVLENDRRDLFGGAPTQISQFTPTGMMIEHATSCRRNSGGTGFVMGFNATARRHDSFSLVYVLDDHNRNWKTTHLPSMQPKRLSSSSSSTFQTTRRLSQILLAAYA
jgi:hypothetical protein